MGVTIQWLGHACFAIKIVPGMEPQVAVLKYLGPAGYRDLIPTEERRERKPGLFSRLFQKK